MHRGLVRDRAVWGRRRLRSVGEERIVRFASLGDLEILKQEVYVSGDIVKRKIEWSEFLVAEHGGKVIGFLQLEYLWSAVPYIALIRVFPEHRNKGIGKSMLQFLEDLLRSNGHSMLYSSSQVDEPEPQEWHRHVGFEECGLIAGINNGIGEVFFRKRI